MPIETITSSLSEFYSLLMKWPLLTIIGLWLCSGISLVVALGFSFGRGSEPPSQPKYAALFLAVAFGSVGALVISSTL